MKPTGIFLFVLYGLTAGEDYRIHLYVSTPMNWDDAYQYCNTYFTDLSTITSEEENQRLTEAGGMFSDAWIGLYKPKNSEIWMWADGQKLNFSKLYIDYSKNYFCAYATPLAWFNGHCPYKRPFFCYDTYKLRLVTQNMTWEDALKYCRNRYTDLASATDKNQLELMQDTLKDTEVYSVWTGLRFMAGKWHMVTKNLRNIPYQGSLLSCPEEPYRCGAYSKTTAQWENRDCDETLSFICY